MDDTDEAGPIHLDVDGVTSPVQEVGDVEMEKEEGEIPHDDAGDETATYTLTLKATSDHTLETEELGRCSDVFGSGNNFIKSVQWSPDGLCALSNSDDNVLRLFDFATAESRMRVALSVPQGEPLHATAWYPLMRSNKPESCVFAATSKDHPIKLWDAYYATVRASYCAYDDKDELITANSICFSPMGDLLYAGYDRAVRVFHTCAPGRGCEVRRTAGTRRSHGGIKGVIASIAVARDGSGMYACGSYGRLIGVYSEPTGDLLATLAGHSGGVTQLAFTPDARYLVSAARKDNEILVWDLRNTVEVVHRLRRSSFTNQRIAFDVDPAGRTLFTGGTDGFVRPFDLATGEARPVFAPHGGDTVAAVSVSAAQPCIATGCGERVFGDDSDSESESRGEVAVFRLPLSI